MLSQLISQFDELCQTLSDAVRRGDEDRVAEADDRILPLMRRIFLMRAPDRSEIGRQVDFFANLAVRNCDDEASVRRYTRMMAQLTERYLDAVSGSAGIEFLSRMQDSPARVGHDASLHEIILDSMPERVALVGRDYRYIYTNVRNAEFHGLRPADFIGRHLRDFIGDRRFRSRAKGKLDSCFEGNALRYHYTVADGEGQMQDVDCRMRPLRGGDSEILGGLIVLEMQPVFAGA
ncbi:PAS domain-containing protein [Hoeflea marina]|uniref:PAS domain-containing protein n=1 Tax=Hoeflea marina TaxID=274592 RepID=A0A317PLL6_9HYPH|nr:PAS domain-containing protein [Hoeflea marina]PWV98953.1 PAS domain-containing protein [Hoeflea marina]